MAELERVAADRFERARMLEEESDRQRRQRRDEDESEGDERFRPPAGGFCRRGRAASLWGRDRDPGEHRTPGAIACPRVSNDSITSPPASSAATKVPHAAAEA